MLHIIGLNHRAQARTLGSELTQEQQVFSNCLLRTIEQVRPVFVAEEDSEEALADRRKVSIAKEIERELSIGFVTQIGYNVRPSAIGMATH